MLRLLHASPVIMGRFVPIAVVHINTEAVLVEEESARARNDNRPVYRKVHTRRQERTLQERISFVGLEAGQHRTTHAERGFGRVGRTAEDRPPDVFLRPYRVFPEFLLITSELPFVQLHAVDKVFPVRTSLQNSIHLPSFFFRKSGRIPFLCLYRRSPDKTQHSDIYYPLFKHLPDMHVSLQKYKK